MSRAELARKADVSYDVLNKIERGLVDQPRGDTLQKIATALGTNELALKYGQKLQEAAASENSNHWAFEDTDPKTNKKPANALPILGDVAAGLWLESSLFENDEPPKSNFLPILQYPASAQYLLKVNGESLNRIAQDGDFILCLDYATVGTEIKSGDLAIVERSRDGGHTIERTAKRVVKHNGEIELRPESDDPRFQEPVIYNEHDEEATEVRVIAKILQVFREIS